MTDADGSHFIFRINDNGVGPNLLHQASMPTSFHARKFWTRQTRKNTYWRFDIRSTTWENFVLSYLRVWSTHRWCALHFVKLQVCLERGWRSYSDKSTSRRRWNLWWRTKGFPVFHCYRLDKEQVTLVYLCFNVSPSWFPVSIFNKLRFFFPRVIGNWSMAQLSSFIS